MQVFEGVLSQIDPPANASAAAQAQAHGIAAAQGLAVGQPVRQEPLERTILLFAERGFPDASASLAPGRDMGTTALTLHTQNTRQPWGASMGMDNGGGTYTGTARFLADASRFELAGAGDELSARTSFSSGTRYLSLAYNVPLGLQGWRAGVNASGLIYALGGPFEALQAKGQATTSGIQARYPLLLMANRQSLAEASLVQRNASDDTIAGNLARTHATYFTLAHSYSLAGQASSQRLQSAFTLGRLNLARNAVALAQDSATAQAAGRYSKVRFDYAVAYSLHPGSQLQARLAAQWAGKNLDSAEKISLGGPNGVRGWPVGEANGDQGAVVNLEWRHQVNWGDGAGISTALTPFIDWGRIQQNKTSWPNALPAGRSNHTPLAGAGVSLQLARPGDWAMTLTLATPIGSNPGADFQGRGADGRTRRSRAWLSLQKVLR